MIKGDISHTQMYLLPLCEVNPDLYKYALYNSFYKNNNKHTYEIHLFLYKDKLKDKDYSKLIQQANYLSDYDSGNYIVIIFTPSKEFMLDCKLLINSRYKDISNEALKTIVKYNIKPFCTSIYYKEVKGEMVKCTYEQFVIANRSKITTLEKTEYTHELCSLCQDMWEVRKENIAQELGVSVDIIPFPISQFQDKFNLLTNDFQLWGQKEVILY